MLDKRGAVLDAARKVSALLRDRDIDGAVIGGIAVVLHGHLRTTRDVDVLIRQSLKDFGDALSAAGATFDPDRREYLLDGVPVHLVPADIAQPAPRSTIIVEGIQTVSLADLINLKLRSGIDNLVRAQDLADVIGLIRHHQLTSAYASKLDRTVRAEFRKLAKAVRSSA